MNPTDRPRMVRYNERVTVTLQLRPCQTVARPLRGEAHPGAPFSRGGLGDHLDTGKSKRAAKNLFRDLSKSRVASRTYSFRPLDGAHVGSRVRPGTKALKALPGLSANKKTRKWSVAYFVHGPLAFYHNTLYVIPGLFHQSKIWNEGASSAAATAQSD